jgi:hypothetical protein
LEKKNEITKTTTKKIEISPQTLKKRKGRRERREHGDMQNQKNEK